MTINISTKQPLEITLATTNQGKKKEFDLVLQAVNPELKLAEKLKLKNIEEKFECEETGNSFLENATQKAQTAAKISNSFCLADDSGLCVEAMDNQPGIYSARFFEDGLGMQKILDHLKDKENRKAYFVCCLVLVDGSGKVVWSTEQKWHGKITKEIKGENGFGYDPLFIPNGYQQTVAELTSEVKNQISHRAQAINAFKDFILEQSNV